MNVLCCGSFLSSQASSADSSVLDPSIQAPTADVQEKLAQELKRWDSMVGKDYRYAQLVAGAAKVPLMTGVWVVRNQEELVTDADLAAFKDATWSEFVRKRYLPSLTSSMTVSEAAKSMLETVRAINLQRKRFQVYGLHEQVEASEVQLVLNLCQAGILKEPPSSDTSSSYHRRAIWFRRHDGLYEAFALAVGAYMCASTPMTLGAGTSRYERDLQHEYKKNNTALFVYALRRLGVSSCGYGEDYVARIARMIIVTPDGAPAAPEVVDYNSSSDDGGGGDGRSAIAIALDARSALESLRDEIRELRAAVDDKERQPKDGKKKRPRADDASGGGIEFDMDDPDFKQGIRRMVGDMMMTPGGGGFDSDWKDSVDSAIEYAARQISDLDRSNQDFAIQICEKTKKDTIEAVRSIVSSGSGGAAAASAVGALSKYQAEVDELKQAYTSQLNNYIEIMNSRLLALEAGRTGGGASVKADPEKLFSKYGQP